MPQGRWNPRDWSIAVTDRPEIQSTELKVGLDQRVKATLESWPAPPPGKTPEVKLPEKPTTLLGSAIGVTWDTVAGSAQTQEQKIERAKKSDQYAEITADTISSIPRVGTLTGGLARGVLLSDVSGELGVGGYSQKFALDVAQGSLLNRVGKFGMSASARAASEGVMLPLGAELKTHFLTGAGFGAVKTAFQSSTYKDAEGNFSAGSTITNFAVGTGLGGTLSVPAGFLGLRVGRASSVLLGSAENSVTQTVVKNVVTGAAGGGAGGAVFGGVEAAREKMSISHIMNGVMEGGLIGMGTGALMGGAEKVHRPLSQKSAPHEQAAGKLVDVPETAPGKGLKADGPDALARTTSASDAETSVRERRRMTLEERIAYLWSDEGRMQAYEGLSFKPFEAVSIKELQPKLKVVGTESRNEFELKADVSAKHEDLVKLIKPPGAKEASWTEFNKLLEFKSRDHVVYQVDKLSTRISVPQEYAVQLNEVRALRLRAEMPESYRNLPESIKSKLEAQAAQGDARGFAEVLPPAEVTKVVAMFEARKALAVHPLRNRVLPEDVIPLLEALPQSQKITEVTLSDKPSFIDAFNRVEYDSPRFSSAARVGQDGHVIFSQAELNSSFTTYFSHELSHLTKWGSPTFSKLFDKATSVDRVENNVNHVKSRKARESGRVGDVEEPGIYHPSEHASRHLDEGWAVGMGEEIMAPDPDMLFVYASKAPVRTMVLSAALESGIKSGGKSVNPVAEALLRRAQYLDEAVRPFANEVLAERALTGTPAQKGDAIELLSLFGGKEMVGKLREIALDRRSKVVIPPEGGNQTVSHSELPAGFARPANDNSLPGIGGRKSQERTVQQAAFDAMVKLSGGSAGDKIQFALQEGLQHPELRDVAREHVFRQNDSRAPFYRRILEFEGQAFETAPLIKQMANRMFADQFGREMAYSELMRARSNNPSGQIEISAEVLTKVPSLSNKVFDQFEKMMKNGLNPKDLRRINQIMEESTAHLTQTERHRAQEIGSMALRYRLVDDAMRSVSNPQQDQMKALEGLAALKDQKAIKPLLEMAISGRPDVERQAIAALGHYSPNIIKHFARSMKPGMANDPVRIRRLDQLLQGRYAISFYTAPEDGSTRH